MNTPSIPVLLYFTCLALPLAAETSPFPAIDDLPDGTALNKVVVPEYNAELVATGLFKAERIVKESAQRIHVEKLHIEKFKSTESENFLASLKSANYYPENNLIVSNEAFTLQYRDYTTHASGLLLKLDPNTGYLAGPAMTYGSSAFLDTKLSSDSNNDTSSKAPTTAGENAAEKTELKATVVNPDLQPFPYTLSKDRIQQLDEYLNLKNKNLLTTKMAEYEASASTQLDPKPQVDAFLKQYGSKLSSSEKNKLPISSSSSTSTPGDIKITYDGGMFYDAEKGLISFMKNIKVDEPRLKVSCSKDLQIFLPIGDEDKKTKNSKGVKKIIAIGDVSIEATKVDKNGTQVLKGKAAVVEFDFITGVTTFKGNYPSFEIKTKDRVITQKAKQKDQIYVIQKNGSFFTKGGGTTEGIQLPNN